MKNFWIRRWFRTLPNYFFVLILLCILNILFNQDFSLKHVNRFFFFSQNIFSQPPSWFFPESWSLSVEEWFYLILPLIIYCFNKLLKCEFRKSLLLISIGLIVIITLFRVNRYFEVSIENYDDWDDLFRKQVSTRLDSILYGIIGAYIKYYLVDLWIKFRNLLFVLGIIMFITAKFIIPEITVISSLYSCVFSFSLISLATLFLIPFFDQIKTGSGFLFKSITYISLSSYSMYLLNLSIIQDWILFKIPFENFSLSLDYIYLIRYILYWFLVLTLSILLYKYFEVPFTNLRDKVKK